MSLEEQEHQGSKFYSLAFIFPKISHFISLSLYNFSPLSRLLLLNNIADDFKKKRSAHYNEFLVMKQAMQAGLMDSDEDEDDTNVSLIRYVARVQTVCFCWVFGWIASRFPL